jgi:hypothetical protein
MKKSYAKPAARKVEIDSDVVRMFTRQGFIELFWERLCEARKENPTVSQEEVFNILNERWYEAMRSYRYGSFDSFRKVRDKK